MRASGLWTAGCRCGQVNRPLSPIWIIPASRPCRHTGVWLAGRSALRKIRAVPAMARLRPAPGRQQQDEEIAMIAADMTGFQAPPCRSQLSRDHGPALRDCQASGWEVDRRRLDYLPHPECGPGLCLGQRQRRASGARQTLADPERTTSDIRDCRDQPATAMAEALRELGRSGKARAIRHAVLATSRTRIKRERLRFQPLGFDQAEPRQLRALQHDPKRKATDL